MYVQSRFGSLSPGSRRTQARAASRPSHEARTAVVFPYPAGAATSVSGASPPASSARRIRGRSTMPGRRPGAASFASASGGASGPGETRVRRSRPSCAAALAIAPHARRGTGPFASAPAQLRKNPLSVRQSRGRPNGAKSKLRRRRRHSRGDGEVVCKRSAVAWTEALHSHRAAV